MSSTTKAVSFLGVDPGVDYFAWVKVIERKIVEVGFWSDNRFLANKFPDLNTCVCETQEVHRGQEKKKRAITALARSAGEIAGQFANRIYLPLSQLPKEIYQQRAEYNLDPEERILIASRLKKEQYHLWDAAGHALRYLGRWK